MTTTPTTRWPTPYILEIYNAAVKHGHIRIEPLTAEQAKSLTQTIYRFRRRSDTGKAAFMRPEFQLITVSPWVSCDASTDTGYMHVVYSADPDQSLPRIVTPTAMPATSLDNTSSPEPVTNIADFVQQMLDKSGAAEKE